MFFQGIFIVKLNLLSITQLVTIRHLQIIYDIVSLVVPVFVVMTDQDVQNMYFLQAVEKKFPGDRDRLARMSLIEGIYSTVFERQQT